MDKPALDEVRETALDKNIGAIVLANIRDAVDCFGAKLPGDYLQEFASKISDQPREKSAALLTPAQNTLRRRVQDFTAFETTAEKFAYVFETLVPPPSYMRFRFELGESDWLWPWYLKRLTGFSTPVTN